MSDLKNRLFIGSLSILVIVLLFVFSNNIIIQYVIAAIIAILSGICMSEYANLIKTKGVNLVTSIYVACSVIITLSFFFTIKFNELSFLPYLLLVLSCVLIALMNFSKIENSICSMSSSVFGLFFIVIPLGLMIFFFLHLKVWLIFLLVVTKIGDIAAYFGGKLLGKKRIAPSISPNKTIVGSFFGLLFSLIASLIFCFEFTFLQAVVLGVVLGVFGQLGDLVESLIKRDADIKDSSVIPGMGGVFDMLDSLLINTYILYFFYLYRG